MPDDILFYIERDNAKQCLALCFVNSSDKIESICLSKKNTAYMLADKNIDVFSLKDFNRIASILRASKIIDMNLSHPCNPEQLNRLLKLFEIDSQTYYKMVSGCHKYIFDHPSLWWLDNKKSIAAELKSNPDYEELKVFINHKDKINHPMLLYFIIAHQITSYLFMNSKHSNKVKKPEKSYKHYVQKMIIYEEETWPIENDESYNSWPNVVEEKPNISYQNIKRVLTF